MTDAPPLAVRSAGTPPATGSNFEALYEAHRVRLFRALMVVTRDVRDVEPGTYQVRWVLGAVNPPRGGPGHALVTSPVTFQVVG